MAILTRIEGDAGTKILSGRMTTDEAKEYYIDQYGYEATDISVFQFDECDWLELKEFARTGNK